MVRKTKDKNTEDLTMKRFPLDIQLFAENDPAPTPTPSPAPSTGYTQEQLDAIADARASKASEEALKDFFKKQGLSQEEIAAAIDKYKADKEANTPDPNTLKSQVEQAQKEAADAKLEKQATLEALKLGVSIEQVPYVLKLAEINTGEKGEVKEEDIKKAIEAVLEAVPAFKPQAPQPKPGIKIGTDGSTPQPQTGNVSLRDAIAAKLAK